LSDGVELNPSPNLE